MSDTGSFPSDQELTSSPRRKCSSLIFVTLGVGWSIAISMTPPRWLLINLLAVGFVLAMIVAWRRLGSYSARAESAVAFFAGVLFFSYFSEFIARVVQNSLLGNQHRILLETCLELLAIVAGLPLFLLVVFAMWQSWNSLRTNV